MIVPQNIRIWLGLVLIVVSISLLVLLVRGSSILGWAPVWSIPIGNPIAAFVLAMFPMGIQLIINEKYIFNRFAKFLTWYTLPWFFISWGLSGNLSFVFDNISKWRFLLWISFTGFAGLSELVLLLSCGLFGLKILFSSRSKQS